MVNAYDPDAEDQLTISLVSGPSQGSLTIDQWGNFEYTAADAVYSDSFTYEASDGVDSTQGVITINSYNNAPQAFNENDVSVLHGQTVSGMANAYDPDAEDTLTFSLASQPSQGSATIDQWGNWEYTAVDAVYADSFDYFVTDGIDTATATIYINVTNQAPVFDSMSEGEVYIEDYDENSTAFDDVEVGQLSAMDPDPEDTDLTYSGGSGLLGVAADGIVTIGNLPGLIAALDDANAENFVSVKDKVNSTVGEFVLSKVLGGGAIDQSGIYVRTKTGEIYTPQTAAELVQVLQQMADSGQIIEKLIIKGHGGPGSIEVGDPIEPFVDGADEDGTVWMTADNGTINIGFDDVTNLLWQTTDGGTHISLRGCFSAPLAKEINDSLPPGPKVTGAVRFTIGIPGTLWGLGAYAEYQGF
jgi:VCBS repeat-containing protein